MEEKNKADSTLNSLLSTMAKRQRERMERMIEMHKCGKTEKSKIRERKTDPAVEVGGVMTLPVWWPGRSTTAGLSLWHN